MPDRAGRVNFFDFMAIAKGWSDVQKQVKADQREAKVNEYGKLYTQGKAPDASMKDYNFEADLTAQTSFASKELNMAKLDEVNRAKRQAALNDSIAMGEQSLKSGNLPQFWESMKTAYSYVPDGRKIVGFSQDFKNMVVENSTGQRSVTPAPNPQQALQMAKTMSTKYQDIDRQFRDWRRKTNLEQISNKQVWVDPKTRDTALHFTIIGEGGEILETLRDPKTGEVLGGFDEKTGEYVKPKGNFIPFQAWQAQAGIKKSGLEDKNIESRTNLNNAQAGAKRNEAGAKEADKQQKVWKQDLELELKPFAGNKATYNDLGELTDEGKTALDAAQRLMTKYKNKQELTADEKVKLPHALRAWKMYEKISGSIYKRYSDTPDADWRDLTDDKPTTTRSPL